MLTKNHPSVRSADLRLKDGSRVAVIGGGPAGSFFSHFLLEMAHRKDLDLAVDIYEPRDFSLPAPHGCNYCAGVISESLSQNLAAEGIDLPTTVIQRAVDSYVLHTDQGCLRIETPIHEKRIGALFRAGGPRGINHSDRMGFDQYILSLAQNKGARIIRARVNEVGRSDGYPLVKTKNAQPQLYDLLAVAAGVNTSTLKLFEGDGFNYKPPKTTKAAIQEFSLRVDDIEAYLGSSLHVFLLDIPKLRFAMIVPKYNYVTVCLLGEEIDETLLHRFLNTQEVKSCFPPDWKWNHPDCKCFPRINIQGAIHPFSDRVVFLGDSGMTRLYKDGIGAAYRATKAAAVTAIFDGISANDFKKRYWRVCKAIQKDNQYGKIIFTITHVIERNPTSRRAILRMAAREQKGSIHPYMSSVLWDTFTGNAPYRDIFLRTLHPAFWSRLIRDLFYSLLDNQVS